MITGGPEDRARTLDDLRRRPVNVHVARGFGPLLVGVVLLALMVLLAPTVAPERIVEEPVRPTTTVARATSTTAAPSTTTVAPTTTAVAG